MCVWTFYRFKGHRVILDDYVVIRNVLEMTIVCIDSFSIKGTWCLRSTSSLEIKVGRVDIILQEF